MLCGNQPFNNENVAHLVHQITTQDLNFDSDIFKQTSKPAIDLMKKLLLKNPEERPSAEEVLSHEWFKITNTGGGFKGYMDTSSTFEMC